MNLGFIFYLIIKKIETLLFQQKIGNWTNRATVFTEKIEPILNSKIKNVSDDAWVKTLYKNLKELNIQNDVDSLMEEILTDFPNVTASQRSAIINVYRNHHLGWICTIGTRIETSSDFEKSLLLFVIVDQGKDTRDAILELNHIVKQGKLLQLPVSTILKKVSKLASTKDVYGWGSTRDLLLRHV